MTKPDAKSIRNLPPVAAMKALGRAAIVSGGDTFYTFRRGSGATFDVLVGPDENDNYVRATVGLQADGEYVCSSEHPQALRSLLAQLEQSERATIAGAGRAHRGFPSTGVRCTACWEGVFRPTNVQGRAFSHGDREDTEINEPLTLPVCTNCGEIRLKDADVALMDAALETEYEATRLAISDGLDDMREGRHRPVSEVFAELRAKMRRESQLASIRELVKMASRDELPGQSLPASVTEDSDTESSA